MMQAPNPRADAPQVGAAARFFLDGVDGPVRAHVDRADDAGLTLRQELPFLKLHGRIQDDHGRRAELTSVGVAVRDGTPSLVLELRYEGRRAEPTVPFQPSRRARRDETQPYVLHRPEDDWHFDADRNDEALRGDAPATPLTPLSIPAPKPAWHTVLWQRVRVFLSRWF
ncbi:MAG: hypothetical protein AAGE52_00570 [Myxococcota bacterium]